MILSIFSYVCWPSICLLWRNVYLSLFPTFWLGCLFFWIELYELLYILKINLLSVVSLAIICSHSEGCLSTLLIVSFAVQKLLSLIKSHLFTFVFISMKYEPCCVGPPKTDGSWWRVLTKWDLLGKGMANHISILTLRTPCTVWKDEKIGHWKMNSPGQ